MFGNFHMWLAKMVGYLYFDLFIVFDPFRNSHHDDGIFYGAGF